MSVALSDREEVRPRECADPRVSKGRHTTAVAEDLDPLMRKARDRPK